jgi:hypothetical protein
VLPVLPEVNTCYGQCLPLLLQCLREEEPGEKQLAGIAKRLEVLPRQLKAWLARGIKEGKIAKKKSKRKLVYVPIDPNQSPILFDHRADAG